jgi:hypothetical protein
MRPLVVMISLLLAACEASVGLGNDPAGGQPADKPMAAANSLTSQADRDAIRVQIERCWMVPDEAHTVKNPAVGIRARFNLDGTLQTSPQIVGSDRVTDPSYRKLAEAARRAVLRCAPFRLPNDKFANRDIVLRFDPKAMFSTDPS